MVSYFSLYSGVKIICMKVTVKKTIQPTETIWFVIFLHTPV